MVALTVQSLPRAGAGLNLTTNLETAAGGGDTFTWSNTTVLYIFDASTGSQTITATSAATAVGTPKGIAAVANAVATSVSGAWQVLDTRDEAYKNSSGLVALTYSGVTTLSVLAVKMEVID